MILHLMGKIGTLGYASHATVKNHAWTGSSFCVPMRWEIEKTVNIVDLNDAKYLLEWSPNG